MEGRTCDNCGASLERGDRFCQSCGKPVPVGGESEPVVTPPVHAGPVSGVKTGSRARMPVWVALAGVVIILSFVIAGISSLNDAKKSTDQNMSDLQKDLETSLLTSAAAGNLTGNTDKAIRDANVVIEANPENAGAYLVRGIAYYNSKNYESALRDFNRVLEINPNHKLAYTNRGIVYYVQGKYDVAIADFNKALSITSDYGPEYDANTYMGRGTAYYAKKDYNKALADYSKAIELQPDTGTAYYNRALTYKALGNSEKANEDMQKACSLGYRKACGNMP